MGEAAGERTVAAGGNKFPRIPEWLGVSTAEPGQWEAEWKEKRRSGRPMGPVHMCPLGHCGTLNVIQ